MIHQGRINCFSQPRKIGPQIKNPFSQSADKILQIRLVLPGKRATRDKPDKCVGIFMELQDSMHFRQVGKLTVYIYKSVCSRLNGVIIPHPIFPDFQYPGSPMIWAVEAVRLRCPGYEQSGPRIPLRIRKPSMGMPDQPHVRGYCVEISNTHRIVSAFKIGGYAFNAAVGYADIDTLGA